MKTKLPTVSKTAAKPSKSNSPAAIAKPAAAKGRSPTEGMGAATAVRSGSKKQVCLDLLGRRTGATLNELSEATGWQMHSVRGFLSGTVKKKLGLALDTSAGSDGVRRYRLHGQGEIRK